MVRLVLAVVVGAAVVAATVRLFIVPVARAAAKVRAIILPGSISEAMFNTAAELATDGGLALPGVFLFVSPVVCKKREFCR